MDSSKIKAIADEIVMATAGLPSAGAVRELLAEYVSQPSQERRIVILADVYSCVLQDLESPAPALEAGEPRDDPPQEYTGVRDRATLDGQLNQQNTACSFCELIHEFYPGGTAGRHTRRMIANHLEREHGVDLIHSRIAR
ncbi:MAG: hypothetical protein JRN23_00305 [Nitrososphaerota archaeon]|nr:hypothetical protein [Nitrososphaerota archaeon]MDG7020353.1 hypothetical protein [Nitrososphaerota archaeon]